MKNILVGATGFVGSNLCATGNFDALYHSKNIEKAYGTKPDLLVYAGLRAEKYLANYAPEEDWEAVLQAMENIRKIRPDKLVLISTIDVFKEPKGVDETSRIETRGLSAYGKHRYQLETWIRENYPEALIIRLPGLFGKNLKKNFIYDYINVIPYMLREQKIEELTIKDRQIRTYYTLGKNHFYRLKDISEEEKQDLKQRFRKLGFTALNFTDSRNRYQFYNLKRLWNDIQIARNAGITLWHPATAPVSAGELYRELTGENFVNELRGVPADYDYKTVHFELYGGQNGYIETKTEILKQIRLFIGSWEK